MRIYLNNLATGDFSFGVVDENEVIFRESSGPSGNKRIIAFLTITFPGETLSINFPNIKEELTASEYEDDKIYNLVTKEGYEVSFLLDSGCGLPRLLDSIELRIKTLVGWL